LQRVAPRKIAKEARGYGLTIQVRTTGGSERIVIPADKKGVKTLLRFLEENYYTSALSGSRFVANSKRTVPVASD
jgi:hypothetical protein